MGRHKARKVNGKEKDEPFDLKDVRTMVQEFQSGNENNKQSGEENN